MGLKSVEGRTASEELEDSTALLGDEGIGREET